MSAPDVDEDKVKIDLTQSARWDTLTVPYLVERGGLETDRPAVVFEDTQRTYGELRDRSWRLANGLVGLGVEPMDRVAVLLSNRLEYIEIEVGIAAARAIMVPLNWRLRGNELANLLRRSEARVVIAEDRFLGTLNALRRAGEVPDLRTIIALDNGAGDLNYEELSASSPATPPERVGRLGDPHEIIFTSGTTSKPKGVVWSNGGVMFNALQQVVDFRLGPESSSYVVIDLYYIGGRHDFTWSVLQAGGTVHIKRSSNFDAEAVVRYVAEHRISHVLWVPTMLYEILALPVIAELDMSHLRMIMCGGQPISAGMTEHAQRTFPHTDFVQVYGLTEAGGSVTFVPPHALLTKPGSAGKPSMHVRIRLVDEHGEDVPPGVDGEIIVQAPSMTAGYWDAPELTAQLLADGWLHTGDLGRFDEDGYLYISGRKGDMIISGGMNIFPSEIEDVLRGHPAVADVAVIGVPHEKWGETVCAVIETAEDAQVDEAALIAYCAERLAGYKKPKAVRVVNELPRTATGKTQKFVLRKWFGEDHASVSAPVLKDPVS